MTQRIFQKIANHIIVKMSTCDVKKVPVWYELGEKLNMFAVTYFLIDLD